MGLFFLHKHLNVKDQIYSRNNKHLNEENEESFIVKNNNIYTV
jgi:hypothetical protein